jgi:hypothetical protein
MDSPESESKKDTAPPPPPSLAPVKPVTRGQRAIHTLKYDGSMYTVSFPDGEMIQIEGDPLGPFRVRADTMVIMQDANTKKVPAGHLHFSGNAEFFTCAGSERMLIHLTDCHFGGRLTLDRYHAVLRKCSLSQLAFTHSVEGGGSVVMDRQTYSSIKNKDILNLRRLEIVDDD